MTSFEMTTSDKLIMLEYRQAIGWRLGGDSDANAMRTQKNDGSGENPL